MKDEPTSLPFDSGLDAAHIAPDHTVRTIDEPLIDDGCWFEAGHFGLGGVDIYRDMDAEAQRAVVAACSKGLLAEAYYIEKAGVSCCAKLCVLSETTEERGDANSLVLPMQVVLEGCGLVHYRSLQRGCRDAGLRSVFGAILRDEAMHHGAGKALYRPERSTSAQQSFIVESMRRVLEMVQVGPRAIAGVVSQAAGGLSQARLERVFDELDCRAVSGRKLSLLRSLLEGSAPAGIVEALDRAKAFQPYDARTCAQIAVNQV